KVAPRSRPDITYGLTQRLETGCGHMYVTINSDELGPCEVFIQMGKVGGCASAQLEAIARLSSLSLRSNINLEAIIRQLKGIRCPSPMWHNGTLITSCGDAVGQALENFLKNNNNLKAESLNIETVVEKHIDEPGAKSAIYNCPDCGSIVEHLEGCLKCPVCGWSKC
ncbi:MAG: TSCPD domain-containing protein, partial [Candidatus Cloacimonetes bacterium]